MKCRVFAFFAKKIVKIRPGGFVPKDSRPVFSDDSAASSSSSVPPARGNPQSCGSRSDSKPCCRHGHLRWSRAVDPGLPRGPPPAHPDARRGHQRTRQPDSGHRHREHHPRAPRHHAWSSRTARPRSSTPIASTWSRKDRSSSPVNIISCRQNPVRFRSWSTGNRPEPATTGTERLPPAGSEPAAGITSPCRRNACASSDCACRESSCAVPWPPASCPPASATCSSYDVASWLSWFDPYPAERSTLRNKVRTVTGDPKELHYEETVR